MAWDSDWTDLLPHSVTIKAVASRNGYGEPTYDSGTAYTARVVKKQKKVRSFGGEETIAQGEIWIKGQPNCGPQHQVTVPSGYFDSTTPPIIGSEQIVDEGGVIGEKLFIG